MPKISIIMPVYNEEKFIKPCMESILNQTFSDFECIIIDDGSTDNTLSILQSYKDKRLKIISRENKGLIASLNEGVGLAKGDYIARMDGDDIMMLDRLEKQIKFLESNPNIVGVGGGLEEMRVDGTHIRTAIYDHNANPILDVFWKEHSNMPGSTLLGKTDLIKKILYNPYYKHAEDRDLLLRLSEHGDLRNLQEPLIKYRRHAGSVTKSYGAIYERYRSVMVSLAMAEVRKKGHPDKTAQIEFDGNILSATKNPMYLLYIYMGIAYYSARQVAGEILRKFGILRP